MIFISTYKQTARNGTTDSTPLCGDFLDTIAGTSKALTERLGSSLVRHLTLVMSGKCRTTDLIALCADYMYEKCLKGLGNCGNNALKFGRSKKINGMSEKNKIICNPPLKSVPSQLV